MSSKLLLPAGFPRDVQAFVCDLDRTLIAGDAEFTPRTLEAIAAAQAAGIRVLIATGRMFRSVRPYLEAAGIPDPVVCYQGALVAEPATGAFLLHEPIPLELAREAIAELDSAGFPPNCYVDDGLAVSRHTPYSQAYASFQHIPVSEVGDLLAWLDRDPTKLVAVGDPGDLAGLRAQLGQRFDGRLYMTTSLPWLLELGHPGVSKATGVAFVADRLGFERARIVAFGDGENDVEMIEWAGFGVSVELGHERLLAGADWICPGPEDDGVARVIEAFLHSHP
jgi:Cof subfamily protein (haloacid dehalogenase superfamily)